MFPWSNPPAEVHGSDDRFRLGSVVYSGDAKGTVVSVDAAAGTMGVIWSDGDGGAIIYPLDATYLRGPMPWES